MMTTATTTPEVKTQTAANNADLARVKAAMNAPIYKHTALVFNAEGRAAAPNDKALYLTAGRSAAWAYLGRFFNDEARVRILDGFFPSA